MTRANDKPLLLEVVLRHTSKRFATTFTEIYDAVLNDYGSTYERRVYRAVEELAKMGAIRIEGKRCKDGVGRDLFRVLDAVPRVGSIRVCSVCGMTGVDRHTHIERNTRKRNARGYFLPRAPIVRLHRYQRMRPDAYDVVAPELLRAIAA